MCLIVPDCSLEKLHVGKLVFMWVISGGDDYLQWVSSKIYSIGIELEN